MQGSVLPGCHSPETQPACPLDRHARQGQSIYPLITKAFQYILKLER